MESALLAEGVDHRLRLLRRIVVDAEDAVILLAAQAEESPLFHRIKYEIRFCSNSRSMACLQSMSPTSHNSISLFTFTMLYNVCCICPIPISLHLPSAAGKTDRIIAH